MTGQPSVWWPRCVICCVILGGRRAIPAATLIAGDAICADHSKLRADCATLGHAIREARADLGLHHR